MGAKKSKKKAKRRSTKAEPFKVQQRGSRGGRPKGALYPIWLRVRISHLHDAFLAFLQARCGGDTDYSTLVRTAIDQYVLSHPEFDQQSMMEVLQDMAHSLRNEPGDLEVLVRNVARVFKMPIESVCAQLGVNDSMLRDWGRQDAS